MGFADIRLQAEPVSWTRYFAQNIRIPSSTNAGQSFNVYFTPPSSPNAPVYVFHHGAGSSGLSFSLVAQHLSTHLSAGIISYDVRHHGLTTINEDAEWDLSLSTLARDQVDVIQGVAHHANWSTRDGGWPDLILVGHRSTTHNPINVVWVAPSPHTLPLNLFSREFYVFA